MKLTEQQVIVERSNKTVYHVGNEVIKLFHKDHPKADVFNEALIHSYVEESGLPIPEVRSITSENGCWALTLEYVEGETLEDMMKKNPRSWKKYIDRLVDIQIVVSQYHAYHLRNTQDKMADEINSLHEIDASTRYELLQRLRGMPRHTKLCHGDFVPSNIVITKKGTYKILDWAHATQGNAGADAAITYLRFSLDDPKKAEYYLRTYCKKSDTPIQYVQKWLPIVAAGELTKHKAEEAELLMKWISVAEYQ